MLPPKKSSAPMVLGIVSIITGLLVPIVGLITGVIGLVLANNGQKTDGLNYRTEIILTSIGIAISVINWIAGIILYFYP